MKLLSRTLFPVLLTSLLAADDAVAEETRTFQLQPGHRISLDLKPGGSIHIIGWDRPETEITYSHRGNVATDVEFIETDRRLKVRARPQHSASGSYRSSNRYQLRVPEGLEIDFSTLGGNITIEGAGGRFEGQTNGGGLSLDGVRGEVSITTMGGSISLKNSEVDGELKTMGGPVWFENVVGDVTGSSMGGEVRYRNVRRPDGEIALVPNVARRVVDSLRRDLRYPTDLNSLMSVATVQVSTMGGSITVRDADHGVLASTMGGAIEIENGRGLVWVNTAGGDIDLSDVSGLVIAKTSGGDISASLTVDETAQDVVLQSSYGDVVVYLPHELGIDLDLALDYTRNSSRDFRIESVIPIRTEESKDWDRSRGTARRTLSAVGETSGNGNRVMVRTINGSIFIKYR